MRWAGVSAGLVPGTAATANNEAKKQNKTKQPKQTNKQKIKKKSGDCHHWTEELSGDQYTHTHRKFALCITKFGGYYNWLDNAAPNPYLL